ncbi:unnamed protein product [Mytilus coruscus]|uniref:C1q domain-containing protein n=1 Tax=Mytilus coruscus TaxID=42192 RepID=A0A6J8E7X3_MYTCO|nr:unnamed protein product [Mytilus coruscus]
MDVSSMNEQLQEFIQTEINLTYNDRIEDTKDQIAVHSLEEFKKIQKEYKTELYNQNTSVEEKLETMSKSFKQEMKAFIREEIKQKVGETEKGTLMKKSEYILLIETATFSMTACTASKDGGFKSSGYVVKFAEISTSSNINNLPTFINNGKFEVEVEGMYLISAWIFSRDISTFSIRKNGKTIAFGYMSGPVGSTNAVATAIVAIELKRQDKIWVQMESSFFIHSNSRTSCFTLIKVK